MWALMWMIACTGESGGPSAHEPKDTGLEDTGSRGGDGLTISEPVDAMPSDADGLAWLEWEIEDGVETVQLLGRPGGLGYQVELLGLADPSGAEVLTAAEGSPLVFDAGAQIDQGLFVLSLPCCAAEHVEAGAWMAQVRIIDDEALPVAGEVLSLQTVSNPVVVAERSILALRVVHADGLEAQEDYQVWVDSVLDLATEAFARIDIDLEITEESGGNEAVLAPPYAGGEDYESLAGSDGEILVVFGEGWTDEVGFRLGQAGLIPVSVLPTIHSAVAIDWAPHRDYLYAEASQGASTLVHELGHALGLVHTLELDGDDQVIMVDGLDDTPVCEDFNSCISDKLACTNLMFYTNACVSDSSWDTMYFSDQQAEVIRGFTGLK